MPARRPPVSGSRQGRTPVLKSVVPARAVTRLEVGVGQTHRKVPWRATLGWARTRMAVAQLCKPCRAGDSGGWVPSHVIHAAQPARIASAPPPPPGAGPRPGCTVHPVSGGALIPQGVPHCAVLHRWEQPGARDLSQTQVWARGLCSLLGSIQAPVASLRSVGLWVHEGLLRRPLRGLGRTP